MKCEWCNLEHEHGTPAITPCATALKDRIAKLEVIAVLLTGEVSEGLAARTIGVDRLTLRTIRDEILENGENTISAHVKAVEA